MVTVVFSGISFLIGLFFISGGISILRGNKFLLVGRFTRPEVWHKPIFLKGKKAVFYGILYIVGGILFIVGAIAAYSAGR